MVRLLAVLVLAGASVNAQTYTSGDWQYTISNGEATITGYTGSGGAVAIPSDVDGVPVKKVGNEWPPIFGYPNTSVTSINIPNSVTSIGDYAFLGCASLTSVNIPNSVTSIGSSAFENCTSLTSVTIPFYTTISNDAFDPGSLITRDFTSLVGRDDFVNTLVSKLANTLATNSTFITNLAEAIKSANGNYGLATKTEVGGAVTMGVQQVLSAPSEYNLFTTQQVQNERTAGQNDVLNTPNSFSLYTTNQIHNLGLGGIVLNRNTNNQLVLNYQVLQSSDLQNWSPYQQTELVISNAPTNKMFLRVQAVGQ